MAKDKFVRAPGLEHYMFSTPCGYFCSCEHSKNLSQGLLVLYGQFVSFRFVRAPGLEPGTNCV